MQDVYFHPYGGIRWSQSGGNAISPTSSTRRTYTGQYDIGFWAGAIQHYNARQYDYGLGRFLQPDTIVPGAGNPIALNRFAYGNNNPTNNNDPTGHFVNIGFAIAGAAIGAAIGAASVALPQMIANVQAGQPLMTNIDPAQVGQAAVVGAVAGGVGGLTFGLGLAAGSVGLAAVGISSGSGVAATIGGAAVVAASSAVAGQTSRAAAVVGIIRPNPDEWNLTF